MAEPLKNHFGPDVALKVGDMIGAVAPTFDHSRFKEFVLDGYEELELTPRARHIAAALEETLPDDSGEAMGLIISALGPEIEGEELTGMDSFVYLPFVYYVANNGLDHFEIAMQAQYELTKRFTAEFSIRSYLDAFPERTLSILTDWAQDDNVHVRRLVSEGTRPRLPWAPRLPSFQSDPEPVIELLEILKDDPAEYVRRSVANNLNDISKDHPDRVVDLAASWWSDGDDKRRRMLRHGLRTLVKAGHPGALGVLGYGADSPVAVASVRIEPPHLEIGESVRITVDLENQSDQTGHALVDLVVHFVKANGTTSPKVFKGGERTINSGESATISKSISMAQFSTRTNYPGTHQVEVQLNGQVFSGGAFELT